jgi:hypothetical protein
MTSKGSMYRIKLLAEMSERPSPISVKTTVEARSSVVLRYARHAVARCKRVRGIAGYHE